MLEKFLQDMLWFSMKLIEFAFKTHFPTAFLEVIFFVFLKFQFNHTGNFFMKQEMWRF